jgi:hypothetical protein
VLKNAHPARPHETRTGRGLAEDRPRTGRRTGRNIEGFELRRMPLEAIF